MADNLSSVPFFLITTHSECRRASDSQRKRRRNKLKVTVTDNGQCQRPHGEELSWTHSESVLSGPDGVVELDSDIPTFCLNVGVRISVSGETKQTLHVTGTSRRRRFRDSSLIDPREGLCAVSPAGRTLPLGAKPSEPPGAFAKRRYFEIRFFAPRLET